MIHSDTLLAKLNFYRNCVKFLKKLIRFSTLLRTDVFAMLAFASDAYRTFLKFFKGITICFTTVVYTTIVHGQLRNHPLPP